MLIKELIKKLKDVKCLRKWERQNVETNIKICEMQIKIIKRDNERQK